MTLTSTLKVPGAAEVAYIVDCMREVDKEELRMMGEKPTFEALMGYVDSSRWSGVWVVQGVPVAIAGVRVTATHAIPWMLGTTELYTHKRLFWTQAKRTVYTMQEEFPYLRNWIWSENTASIRWLEKLGFTIGRKRFPLAKGEALLFERRQNV